MHWEGGAIKGLVNSFYLLARIFSIPKTSPEKLYKHDFWTFLVSILHKPIKGEDMLDPKGRSSRS